MHKNFTCNLKCGLPTTLQPDTIVVHGAKEHNLKNICFTMPKGKLIALTGLSGSGKSSIAFNVLGQECIRLFLESMSMTTDHVRKAKVDNITGSPVAICIQQKVTDFNPRSTVGTKTGIHGVLRNLFAAIGHQSCESCETVVAQPLKSKDKLITIETKDENSTSSKKKKTSYFDCPQCGEDLVKLKMEHFSYETEAGHCEDCKGKGESTAVDIDNILDEGKTLRGGGVKIWDEKLAKYKEGIIVAASNHYQFSFNVNQPIGKYTEEEKDFLLYGITSKKFVKKHKEIKAPKKVSDGKYDGVVPYLMEQHKKHPDQSMEYMVHETCATCQGTGLGRLGRTVTIAGKTILEVSALNLTELLKWFQNLEMEVTMGELHILEQFSTVLEARTSNLIEVGLGYLTLDRSLPTLSGGESQRHRLANVLGNGLSGVLYVLDEPTTGLHPYNTAQLLKSLRMITDAGNTVLLIEHDTDMIQNADYIIDVGPGRGTQGGKIVVSGPLDKVMDCQESVTGQHLSKKAKNQAKNSESKDGDVVMSETSTVSSASAASAIPASTSASLKYRSGKSIIIHGASEHNLQNIDVTIPLNQFVVLTGVSGSGKSTLLFDILDKVARKELNNASEKPGKHTSIEGLKHIKRIVTVDQYTIGRTKSRSNVATYTKLFDSIRDVFASLKAAKDRGFDKKSFSFNASAERCQNCNGSGVVDVDLSFMKEVEMECYSCNGMRFNENLLEIKFKGYNISQILDMTVSDAVSVFSDYDKIVDTLNTMVRVGLDHLTLGQSTSTLSGGEAQRIKLAPELAKTGKASTLYLLDEPTTGLHPAEVEKLLGIFRELVKYGNTVVAVEHNLDVICAANTIIDFGPGGGIEGGKIVVTGSPKEVAANKDSFTGLCLRAHFSGKSVLTAVLNPGSGGKSGNSNSTPSERSRESSSSVSLSSSYSFFKASEPQASVVSKVTNKEKTKAPVVSESAKEERDTKKKRIAGMEHVHMPGPSRI